MIKNSPALYVFNNRKIDSSDILSALKRSGIKNGDVIFVHSELSAFGKIGDIKNRDEFLSSILGALKSAVGEEGTIVMPTFSYSFCNGEDFSIDSTPSTVGILTEYFRKQPDVIRTLHPIFSAAILGKEKKFLSSKLSKDSFGKNSIFGKLYKKKCKVLFLGASFQSCTFIHYIEQLFGVPYRYHKKFEGRIKTKNKTYKDTYSYFVRFLDKNVETDLSQFEKYLIKNKIMKEIKLGSGRILTVDSSELVEEGLKLLKKNRYFFLKEKPNL